MINSPIHPSGSGEMSGAGPVHVPPEQAPPRPRLFRHKILPCVLGLVVGWVVCWFVDQGTDPITTLRALRVWGEERLADVYRDEGWPGALGHGNLHAAHQDILRSFVEHAVVSDSRMKLLFLIVFLGADPGAYRHTTQISPTSWTSSNTPLDDAASQGRLEIVRILMDHGALKDPQARWALSQASCYGHADVVELMVGYGLPVEDGSDSALFYAVMRRDERLFGILLPRSVVNHQNWSGCTALHLAVFQDHLAIARKLIAAGANPLLRAKNGLSPLDYARLDGRRELVVLFDEAVKLQAASEAHPEKR